MSVIRRWKYDANENLKELSFTDLISWCCMVDEISLRKNIKNTLVNHGFTFTQDSYRSERSLSDISKQHLVNLLLTRGNNPAYCLVAHTDVCRDHTSFENKKPKLIPNPVIKDLNGRSILQDKDCKVQIGGDDRLGVAIILWCALHTDHEFGILFTTDEEIGLVSASQVNFTQLNEFKLLIEIDRGNDSNQLVNTIRDVKLCEDNIIEKLVTKLSSINLPREVIKGYGTDVFIIKKNGMCQNAINMTCGYHDSEVDSGSEYIDLQEAEEAQKCVISFLEDQTLV